MIFLLKIINRDVRDSFGSFGTTDLYFSESQIYTLEDFKKRQIKTN